MLAYSNELIQQIINKTNHYLELLNIDEQELVSVSALVPGYVCWKDNKGRYQGCNEKFAQLLGFSSVDEIKGLTDEQLPWKAHYKLLKRMDAEILATGVARALEEGITLPDQSVVDFFTKRIPIHNSSKDITGILIVLFDITAQKEILKSHHHDQNNVIHELKEQIKQLKSENFLLKQVIDNLPGSVYWKDTKGVYLGNNGYAKADMHMIEQENMDPTGKTDFELFGEEVAEKFRKNDLEVITTGKEIVSEEPYVTPEGKVLTRLSSKKPLYDATGAIVGIVGNTIDITHLKEVEADLRQAKQQAEAANRAKTEFIRNISHDMRTPLVGSIGGMQLISDSIQDPKAKSIAACIKTSIEQLLNLMNEIIDVSKLELVSRAVVHNKFSIKQMLEHLGDTFMPTFHDRNLTFSIVYESELPNYVIGDNWLIHRILLNLLGNAVKFTQKGSINLAAKVAKISDDEITVVLSVSDTGMGIPADKLEQIFEAFQRLTPAYSNRYKGSGLGLFYVKQYVQQLKGEIYVTSEEGKGSTFTCVIPFKRALVEEDSEGAVVIEDFENAEIELAKISHSALGEVSLEENPTELGSSKLSERLHALVVEDTPLARKAAEGLLIKQGYEVTIAENAAEALEKANTCSFDLIYMDIGLPDGNGIEVTRAIRTNVASPNVNTTIVALTAHADNEITTQCIAAGMQDVLEKPLDDKKIEVAETVMNNHIFGKESKKASSSTENFEDLPVIDMAAAVQATGGSEEVAKEMLNMLMKDLPSVYKDIEEAYNNKNWELLKQHVHKLHGALCYCGLPRFRTATRVLEHQIKDNVDNYEDVYKKFVDEMNLAVASYQELKI